MHRSRVSRRLAGRAGPVTADGGARLRVEEVQLARVDRERQRLALAGRRARADAGHPDAAALRRGGLEALERLQAGLGRKLPDVLGQDRLGVEPEVDEQVRPERLAQLGHDSRLRPGGASRAMLDVLHAPRAARRG